MFYRSLAPGTVLSGRYQVAEAIGGSELSHVYASADLRGQAQVALKVFDPSVALRAAALTEYQAQARQASSLGVEGIARAYDFGIDANTGLAFSTAERISWVSLDQRVLAQGPLGAGDLSRALGVLGRALDAAHAAGVVHRDLKPQNVFISSDNPEWVRITDFGVSAVRRGAPETMGWGGPPGYTPPEGVDASAPATPALDLFALGVIAFFALTRGTPFRSLRSPGFDPNAHWSELNQTLHPVSGRAKEIGVALDPAFDPWFARALSLQTHERFRSAGELAREFGAIAEQVGARGGGGPRTMPGIAAAIAQPLVFQPEPSPASLGLAATHPTATSPMRAAAAAPLGVPAPVRAARPSEARLVEVDDELGAGLPSKGSKLPWLIGLGVLLLGGVALAAYALVAKPDSPPAPETSARAAIPPPSTPAIPAPAPEPAPAPAASASAPPVPPVQKRPVAAAPKPAAPKPAAAKPAIKGPPKPVAKAPVKPAPTSKPTATPPKKKKCPTFLGCK